MWVGKLWQLLKSYTSTLFSNHAIIFIKKRKEKSPKKENGVKRHSDFWNRERKNRLKKSPLNPRKVKRRKREQKTANMTVKIIC